jgi:1,4-dihydroxy-2-naphthoate octaprenyltransferase
MIPTTWAKLTRFCKSLYAIRRMEFFPVEITIFTMPLLVSVAGVGQLLTPVVFEGYLTFFVLFSLGDMINCLADRDLDKTYKGRLARAVDYLGVPFVTALVAAEAVLALLLGAHLAWVTGKPALLVLVGLELVLAIQYSVGPFHFKSRGLAQLPCLWLILYFLPMLFAALLVQEALTLAVVLLAAGYATIEMGIILVNTSEDYPEDLAKGIRTVTVALGLRQTLWLAAALVLLGGVAFVGTWTWLCLAAGTSVWGLGALLALVAACTHAGIGLWRLARRATAASAEDAIRLVKAHGKLVPAWATVVGWAGLACGSVLLLFKAI